MAEMAIAGIFVPSVATLAAPIVGFLCEKARSNAWKLSLDDMHEVLNHGLKELLALQKDKDDEVSRNLIHKDQSESYKNWKQGVPNIQEKVASLNKEYDEVRTMTGYFLGRSGLEQKIKIELEGLIKHVEKCSVLEILVDKRLERVIKEFHVPSIAEYETLSDAFKEIQDRLKEVKCVALRGHKGAGKTTIMRHLNNHFYDSPDHFDVVIFIKVSWADKKIEKPADKEIEKQIKEIEKRHIMQKIAGRLKVPDGEDIESDEVARGMQRVLENKRYLLILDGVRLPHTLDHIWRMLGISEDKRDSKVVIATDYRLASEWEYVNRTVNLKKLSDTDAWKMFQGIGGNDLPQIAQKICERFCCRLPLLIDPIAKSFKYQERPIDWERALEEGTPWPESGVEGLDELYSNLEKNCYERLPYQREKKCFLYASLYPANSKICKKYLVECCIAQGFLDAGDAKNSKRRRNAIDMTLKYLVNVAFLEEEEQMRYVKMSDFYRELALYISSKISDPLCKIYVDNEELDERPSRPESWPDDVRWVSMINSKRDSLTTNENCKSLQTLLLQKGMNLVTIPPDYFESMGNLLVLNLYGTKINRLPSLEGLSKLKVLYINGCSELEIESHEEIESLKHLEVFDIRDTLVDFVPCLESLWCLRISYNASRDQSGDSSNYHRIQELHKLEELTIEVKSPLQWSTNAKSIIEKVASLENLTTFKCRFFSSEALEKFQDASKSWGGKPSLTDPRFAWDVKTKTC